MDADSAVRFALNGAREGANRMRLDRIDQAGWLAGYELGKAVGQLLVAQHDMGADPLLAEAVRNEIKFLLIRGYVERGHA